MGTFTPAFRPPIYTMDNFSQDAQIVLRSLMRKFGTETFSNIVAGPIQNGKFSSSSIRDLEENGNDWHSTDLTGLPEFSAQSDMNQVGMSGTYMSGVNCGIRTSASGVNCRIWASTSRRPSKPESFTSQPPFAPDISSTEAGHSTSRQHVSPCPGRSVNHSQNIMYPCPPLGGPVTEPSFRHQNRWNSSAAEHTERISPSEEPHTSNTPNNRLQQIPLQEQRYHSAFGQMESPPLDLERPFSRQDDSFSFIASDVGVSERASKTREEIPVFFVDGDATKGAACINSNDGEISDFRATISKESFTNSSFRQDVPQTPRNESRLENCFEEIKQYRKRPLFRCPRKLAAEREARPPLRSETREFIQNVTNILHPLVTHGKMRKTESENLEQSCPETICETREKEVSVHGRYKTCSDDHLEARDDCQTVVDLAKLGATELDDVRDRLEAAGEISLTLVFTDRTTQMRGLCERRARPTRDAIVQVMGLYFVCKNQDSLLYYAPLVQDTADEGEYRCLVSDLLSSATRKVCYNAKDVIKAVIKVLPVDERVVIEKWLLLDPRLACWLLDPDHPPRSFSQCLLAAGLKTDQNEEQSVCEDLVKQSLLMERLYRQLEMLDMWQLFYNLESRLVTILAVMEGRRLAIDTQKMRDFGEILKKNIQALEIAAHSLVGRRFSLTSHVQLRQILFDEMKLDEKLPGGSRLQRTSVQNEKSTSEAVLNQLVEVHPLPAIVLEHRQLSKLKSTYVDGLLSYVSNGLLYTHWDQVTASTGRLQSVHPNVQAIPKTPLILNSQKNAGKDVDDLTILLREPFVTPSGYSFLVADFQQIEFRLLAHLSGDPELLRLFVDTDGDVFSNLSSQWLKKPVGEVSNGERERTKRMVYSVMYGVGKERLSEYLHTSPQGASDVMQSFLKRFPAVCSFSRHCVDACRKQGYSTSIFRRRRLAPNIGHTSAFLRAQAERQAVNFTVQGSAADLCKAAMVQVEHRLASRRLDARTVLQIHDELVLEVNDLCLAQVADVVCGVMQSADGLCGPLVRLGVPLRVSVSAGKSWGRLAPYHTQPKGNPRR